MISDLKLLLDFVRMTSNLRLRSIGYWSRESLPVLATRYLVTCNAAFTIKVRLYSV
jgi:hypothetical protein